jgi:phospholipid/cholesterol/gamma-HCH transport system permease protein
MHESNGGISAQCSERPNAVMSSAHTPTASLAQPVPDNIILSGHWTVRAIDDMDRQLDALVLPDAATDIQLDGSHLNTIDSIGAWVLQKRLQQLRDTGSSITLHAWPPQYERLMKAISARENIALPQVPQHSNLERIGKRAELAWQDTFALISFIGEIAITFVRILPRPQRWRWLAALHNVQIAGFNALPIICITSFLLGIVIAYQGADQLRHYGANIFVVDLVGYSVLREFAPLMTAIIIAGRSGSSYAAQIGTMVVTEEIDALRTVGIEPIDLLVIPKIIALLVALPLLTVFADGIGVFGGMVMATTQLGVGFPEFIRRFSKAISVSQFLVGVGKAVVFSIVIAVIGCFQGFRTKGNADSVGHQTTRSVVQSIFIVIVLDAVFSIIFSILGI